MLVAIAVCIAEAELSCIKQCVRTVMVELDERFPGINSFTAVHPLSACRLPETKLR